MLGRRIGHRMKFFLHLEYSDEDSGVHTTHMGRRHAHMNNRGGKSHPGYFLKWITERLFGCFGNHVHFEVCSDFAVQFDWNGVLSDRLQGLF